MAGSASSTSSRYIDIAISVRLADVEHDSTGRPRWKPGSDEELLRVGGRWDRRKKRWSANQKRSTRVLPLRFHRGQEEAARWFVEWLRRFVRGDWRNYRRAYSVLLIGGRRSGKTHLACAAMIIFAVLNPKSLLWAISPTLETGDELDEAFREMLPRGWYTRRQAKTGRSTTFTFANGSRLLLKSAVKPQRLKAGRVDLCLLNEAQELSKAAYVKVRAPIADRGGVVLMTANPPETPSGRWVEDFYNLAKASKIDAEVFELDPRNNPWINHEALLSMGKEIDAKSFERDVLGLFPPIGDIVFHAWSDRESIREPSPDWEDVTAQITKLKLGRAAGYVVGMDFQLTPHMAAAVFKFFREPSTDEIIPWIVDEVIVEDADENDLLDALEAIPRWIPGDGPPEDRDAVTGETYRGWIERGTDSEDDPVHCAVVMDASAWWQDGKHEKNRQSDRVLASRRWSWCYRPRFEPEKRNNPEISERVKTTNAQLKTKEGRRRLFSCAHNLDVNKAMRSWENNKFTGQPNRRSQFAHACDAVSYVVYRFFGKPKVRKTKHEYRSIGKRTRASELAVW